MFFKNHGSRIGALSGFATAFLLLAGSPSQAGYKQIRDVSVLCDFAANCTLSLNPGTGENAPGIGLYRSSKADSIPELRLSFSEQMPKTGKLKILVDGKPELDTNIAALKVRNNELIYADEAGVAKLIGAMKNGQKLQLKLADKVSGYSLSGFVGGLIYLDEQQARDGTVAALQVKGAKPAPAAPDITLIETVEQIPEGIRKDFSDDAATCGGASPESFRLAGGFVTKIADGLDLVGLPCGAPGAYNQPYVFYSRYENRIVPVSLPVISDDGPTTTDSAWNIDWNNRTRTLTGFFKGRGIGDCGTYDVWKVVDSGEGRVSFVLKEERAKGDCDGNYAGGPQNWPASWPPRTK
ncbi:DUF1176 domain-containing protein [Brucella sp. BO2]|uniref:DUF1176 domain-containing protein n=1 Tax=Brucella sp. BO2 TaxID=693750 RepID=UPI000325D599|nr:DUF1176 domain-containing protein [Brucella sp. BO2]QPN28927.1 DUF1176 domain-containing protein [Brucella sp. BO2]